MRRCGVSAARRLYPLTSVSSRRTATGRWYSFGIPILGLDHVQIAIPRGSEEKARAFYGGLLGLEELPKPAALRPRGGVWFKAGGQELHLGVEEPFAPARKAHPGLVADDLGPVRASLAA